MNLLPPALFCTPYGGFTSDGQEYVITRPDTPRPWVNVVSNGDYGFIVSQVGGGYSWRTHASLNRLTRWDQDLIRDEDGRYLYLRDNESEDVWSAAWQPTQPKYQSYECRHGLGYTSFRSTFAGVDCTWTLTVAPEDPVEIWLVELSNQTDHPRSLSLISYMEWLLGAAPDWHREFHRIFIETSFNKAAGAILAHKNLWEVPGSSGPGWNRGWPYTAFHAAGPAVAGFETNKISFLGNYGRKALPHAVQQGHLEGHYGRWGDGIGALHVTVGLQPGESKAVVFVLGAADNDDHALTLAKRYTQVPEAQHALEVMREGWNKRLGSLRIESPDEALNLLSNTWLPYQVISCRLWGRSAYYQMGGAYGFRDQLQDSLVWLLLGQSEKTLQQVRLHATHQYADGSVLHWWHPLAESGLRTGCSDDLLWLPFVLGHFVEETGDISAFDIKESYLDDNQPATLWDHCARAIQRVLGRFSPRGLPLIGDCDWNDGLNACGYLEKGESIWLAQFLFKLLNQFADYAQILHKAEISQEYRKCAALLFKAVQEYGWDGAWYWGASTDDGRLLGSHTTAEGSIFLNTQTWAILSGLSTPERTASAWASMEKHLLSLHGPLVLAPAYQTPDSSIGYITRYAPGLRENGGVYTHAAAWALLAACQLGNTRQAYQIFRAIAPPIIGMNPESYAAEPYVTPGNIDGPDSPNFGRGGWSWYTGSAQWLLRSIWDGLLGIQARLDGLHITPCLPAEWEQVSVQRIFRGCTYQIEISNPERLEHGKYQLWLDGQKLESNTLICPDSGCQKTHLVRVIRTPNV